VYSQLLKRLQLSKVEAVQKAASKAAVADAVAQLRQQHCDIESLQEQMEDLWRHLV